MSNADVLALLARLAEVEAERDGYWQRFNSSQDSNKTLAGQCHDLAAENARLIQQLAVVEERELSALAQLSAVEGERDAYRKSMIRYDRDWDAMVAERDEARSAEEYLGGEIDKVEATCSRLGRECDAMRPVVEAAQACVDAIGTDLDYSTVRDLAAELDAYRAGQKAPADRIGGAT